MESAQFMIGIVLGTSMFEHRLCSIFGVYLGIRSRKFRILSDQSTRVTFDSDVKSENGTPKFTRKVGLHFALTQ
jgi:hypothetical protein